LGCRPPLLDWRDGVDWPANSETLDVGPLVRKGFVNQVVMIDAAAMHPNVPLDFSPRFRNVPASLPQAEGPS
jgi:hypothetical protein